MLLVRAAVILSVTLAAAQGADARTKRAGSGKPAIQRQQPREAAPTPLLRLIDAPRTGTDRWMLQPIAEDYEPADDGGFRLRLRGAKMKMRVPLDLN